MRKSDRHPFLSARQERLSRHLVQVVLPAFGALYFGLSQNWGLPATENVIGTTSVLAVFFGTILGVNNRRVPDSGEIHVEDGEEGVQISKMALDATPEELSKMAEVRFRVQRSS